MNGYWKLFVAVLLLAVGAVGGWKAQGWNKDLAIAELKRTQAETSASQYKTALSDFVTASTGVNANAVDARQGLDALAGQLASIRKDFQNAKVAPLPLDCKPTAPRVQRLYEAARATDAAIDKASAGTIPGPAVQGERPTGSP